MNFETAFTNLLGHEGAYSNHKDDPGGETMWGVTIAVARANGYQGSMRDMTQEQAKAIYRKLYWDAVRAEELPPAVRYAVFDAAVNSGVRQAILWLQRAIGVTADGVIGPVTLRVVHEQNPENVLRKMLAQRLRFMTSLSNWPAFGRGWARRVADLMEV